MRNQDDSMAELGTTSPEYPSPVSVLDSAVYTNSEPLHLNQILETFKGKNFLIIL